MSRIYGGEKAKEGQFPYQVRLQSYVHRNPDNVTSCSGSLIRFNWVLTAGHCLVYNEKGTPARVYDVIEVTGDFEGELKSNGTQHKVIPTTMSNPIFPEGFSLENRSAPSGQFNSI